jgi:hypothetical protein
VKKRNYIIDASGNAKAAGDKVLLVFKAISRYTE